MKSYGRVNGLRMAAGHFPLVYRRVESSLNLKNLNFLLTKLVSIVVIFLDE